MRIGIFGGTFNPIHLGHLRAAEEAKERAGLHKIIFVPSGSPPLKSSGIIDANERYGLVRSAVRDNEGFEVSDIEVSQTGRSYTVNTIERLLDLHRDDEMFFISGIDAFLDMPLWREPERLLSLIDFIVLKRPGYPLKSLATCKYLSEESADIIVGLDNECLDTLKLQLSSGRMLILLNITELNISSTMIRQNIRIGRSIKYLVPECVLNEIVKQYISTSFY